jgi:serine/threonine-protein kinase
MLFEMVTGTVPFGGDSAVNIAFQHVNSAVPPASSRLADVPPALDELIVRATRREPGARPADAGAFLAELRHVRADIGAPIVPVSAGGGAALAAATMPTRAVAPPTQLHRQQPGAVRRPGGNRGGLIAVIALAVLGLLAAGAGWWLGAGQYTQAPSLMSLDRPHAEAKARSEGLAVAYGNQEYNETVPKGFVVHQDPIPNGRVRKGGEVLVFLSLGPERYQVPALKGKPQADAEKALADAHLKSTTKAVFSDDVQSGIVIDSTPKEGTALTRDTIVTLSISQGAKPAELPDLTGKTRAEAEQIIADLGLTVQVNERDVGDENQRGRVLQQQPGPGAVTPKTVVQLVVGRGDARVQVPNLQGLSFDDVKRALREQGLKLQRIGGRGQVIFQLPLAGTEVNAGSEVRVWFSR